MSSLDTFPHDILQHIAFCLATSSPRQPSRDLFPLLLTCLSIYRALNPENCPKLYARIFRHTFDIDPLLHMQLPDTILAAEFCRRQRILWRTRRMDLSSDLCEDEIWAAMRLLLERGGRNERILSEAGFLTFIRSFVLQRLTHAGIANLLPSSKDNNTSLAMWLLCLSLSHQDIVEIPEEIRNALCRLLRFPAVNKQQSYSVCYARDSPERVQRPLDASADQEREALLADAAPIIILIFALNEVVPIAIPLHVPETRAIAIAAQRSGPTVEDLRAISSSRTPLFAETKVAHTQDGTGMNPAARMSSAAHLDLLGSRMNSYLYSTYIEPKTPAYVYVPGFLSGLWEGSFMISGEPIPASPQTPLLLGKFTCLKPMQCAITEYLCFSPRLPIPLNYSLDLLEPATLPDHEQAWGGFKFAGRIRADGYMIMCREPKGDDREALGTWIFEGHLRYGVALVGQWRTSVSTETYDLRGIFSLRKTSATWRK
ncbi:hypothetical protein H0H92_011468 [Tricholoma furcatifolium]|nr:hypothetical protein H0H92_011468 [Tricholoma furcatifolium]